MTDLIWFIGRFHVLVLHLPIGILLLTALLHFLARRPTHAAAAQVLPLCWAVMALTAVATVVLGLMHVAEGGFEGPAVAAHRNYGISVALLACVLWYVAARQPALYRRAGSAGTLLLLGLVTLTGHYGGNLTHGSDFLLAYAPAPLRTLAGAPERRATVTDVLQADPWHDLVQPLLQSRCSSCHNADKQRGQLDLSSLATLLAGGDSGPAAVSGAAVASELYRRVSLPEQHEDFMPAEGKTALSAAQVRLLQWWIDSALPVDMTLEALAPDAEILALAAQELGLAPVPEPAAEEAYPALSADVQAALFAQGWLLRPRAQHSAALIVSRYSPGETLTADLLVALQPASAAIVDLDLAAAGLDAERFSQLPALPALQVLNLGNNQLTDDSLATLQRFPALQMLNLHGNAAISDAGLAALSELPQLRRVYLWGTGSSAAALAALAAARPDLQVQGQASARTSGDTVALPAAD